MNSAVSLRLSPLDVRVLRATDPFRERTARARRAGGGLLGGCRGELSAALARADAGRT